MYQLKVDVDVLNAVKSVLASVSFRLCSNEELTLETSANTLYVDTLYVLPLRRRRRKLVLTGTSIPV